MSAKRAAGVLEEHDFTPSIGSIAVTCDVFPLSFINQHPNPYCTGTTQCTLKDCFQSGKVA